MLDERIKEPGIWLQDWFGVWWREGLDLNEVSEQMLERAPRLLLGITSETSLEWTGVTRFHEGIDKRLREFLAARNPVLNQEGVEQAALAQNITTARPSVSFGSQMSGKAIEIWPQRATPEVNEGAFLLVPVLKHKSGTSSITTGYERQAPSRQKPLPRARKTTPVYVKRPA